MRFVFSACGGILAATAGLVACNSVLGIGEASLEPADARPVEAGTVAFLAVDNCNAYCSDIGSSCPTSGPYQEYLSPEVCQQMCQFHTAHYDEQGLNEPVDISPTSAAASGDSIYCRVWHSHAAIDDPQEHCPHAGPLGAYVCGASPCDDFCSQALQFCGAKSYASFGDCMDACNADAGYPGFPYLMGPDASDLQGNGNTLNCRIYHLQNFLKFHDPVHCTHVAKDGGGTCVNSPPAP